MNDELWENKKSTKKAYKVGLNDKRRGNDVMRLNTFRSAMENCDSKKFWAVWNKNNTSKNVSCTHTADEFAHQFGGNFKQKTQAQLLFLNKNVTSWIG
jgi:hypothetical protein